MRRRVKSDLEGMMMSTAFHGGQGGQVHGEFSTSTYLLSQDPAAGSEMLIAVEEEAGDPVDQYFACITTCSLDDGECITICTEQLRESH